MYTQNHNSNTSHILSTLTLPTKPQYKKNTKINNDNKVIASSENIAYVQVHDSGIQSHGTDLFGENIFRYIDPELEQNKFTQLIGTPVSIEHNPKNVVGKVIDAFYNTEGFTTESGAFLQPNRLGIVVIQLFTDIVSMDKILGFVGTSTEMDNVEYAEGLKVNNGVYSKTIKDFKYTGITFTNSPRSSKSNVILNSINNEPFFNNMDKEQLKQVFLEIQKELEDLKAMEAKEQQQQEAFSSLNNSVEDFKNFKNSTSEIITSLQNSISEMKEKIDNIYSVKNSEDETIEEEKKEEEIENSEASEKEDAQEKEDARESEKINNSLHTENDIIRFNF